MNGNKLYPIELKTDQNTSFVQFEVKLAESRGYDPVHDQIAEYCDDKLESQCENYPSFYYFEDLEGRNYLIYYLDHTFGTIGCDTFIKDTYSTCLGYVDLVIGDWDLHDDTRAQVLSDCYNIDFEL